MARLTRLLGELHRRSIWQALGSYAVGSWLVLQLAETLSSLLGLPLWFGPTVIGLLLLGVPFILLTSVYQGGRTAEEPRVGSRELPVTQRLFRWRSVLFTGAAVALLFIATTGGYLGLRQLGIGPFGTLQAKGIIAHEERVILAQFDNRSSDPTIGETVTALFRIDLAQSDAITLLEPAHLIPVLERMERPPETPLTLEIATEVAEREGIKAIVSGEVLPLGAGFVISTRLVSVADGSSLIAERETASEVAEVPKAVDRLSAKLRERIGESLRTIQGDPPLEDVTTGSIAALRSYARAVRANDAGDFPRAVSLLEEALEADSTFAMALRKLGIILTNGNLEPGRATEAFERAYARRDRLTERERYLAEAAYHTYVSRDDQSAEDAYRSLLDRYATDGIALNNLGLRLQALERLEEAEELYRRAIDSRTATPATYSNAMTIQVALGMSDRAEETLRSFETVYPGHPSSLRNGAALAASRFDFEGAASYAIRLREAFRGDPIWESVALFELSGLALVRGRPERARELTLLGYDVVSESGMGFTDVARSLFEAQLEAQYFLVFRDQPERALRIMDEATTGEGWESVVPASRGLLTFAQLYAEAGEPRRATSLIALYEAEIGDPPAGDLRAQADRTVALGHVAMAEGHFLDAVRHFRDAEDAWQACPLCGIRELGQAFELAGQPDSAMATYERYLDAGSLYRVFTDGMNLWRALTALAGLYEERGESDRAAEMYGWFVDLWAGADAELRPRVEDARRALARLNVPGGDLEGRW